MFDNASTGDGVDERFSALRDRHFGAHDTTYRLCPLCGTDNADTAPGRYSLGNWHVKDCVSCGFVYIDTAPDYSVLSSHASWELSSKVELEWRETSRPLQTRISKATRWRFRLLRRRTKMRDLIARYAAAGNVLDLGCGDGGQLDGLERRFVPHGIEIAADGAAKADKRFRERGGRAIHAPCLVGLRSFEDATFAGATLRSYLEHEEQPLAVLRELHRTLIPGGIAIVKVPNYASLNRRLTGSRWCGFRHPDHLNYFTPSTLRRMAHAAGFDTWFGWSWRLPTSDNMYAILTKI